MAAKTVRISRDGGANWALLPGNDASIDLDGQELDTTIFGSDFNSAITGIIEHSLTANALLRKTAGFEARLKTIGVATPFTAESFSLVDGWYVIDDRSKSFWNINEEVIFSDIAGTIDPEDIAVVDYMNGKVRFVTGFTPDGAVTATGEFHPTANFGCANSIDLTQSSETIETGCFETVGANGGFQTYEATLRDVSLDIEGFYRESNDFYETLLAREEILIEIDWDGKGTTICRGVFRVSTDGYSGGTGGDETESVSFVLSVPEGILPFSWYFAPTSDAPLGLKWAIQSWEDKEAVKIQYLPKGVGDRGFEGDYIITDCSMSTAVDAIGEASITGQGTGAIVPINV